MAHDWHSHSANHSGHAPLVQPLHQLRQRYRCVIVEPFVGSSSSRDRHEVDICLLKQLVDGEDNGARFCENGESVTSTCHYHVATTFVQVCKGWVRQQHGALEQHGVVLVPVSRCMNIVCRDSLSPVPLAHVLKRGNANLMGQKRKQTACLQRIGDTGHVRGYVGAPQQPHKLCKTSKSSA